MLDYEEGKNKERKPRNPAGPRKIKEEQKVKVYIVIRGAEDKEPLNA